MKEQEVILDHLSEVYQDLESGLNGSSGRLLHDLHKRSFDALKRIPFPDRKHEDWKYTSVQKLISPKYKLATYHPDIETVPIPGLESFIISIINGEYDFKDLDPDIFNQGVKVMPLAEAFEDPSWIQAFGKMIASAELVSNRLFEFLNLAFHTGGFWIDIPNNTILNRPIEIRVIHDEPGQSFSHPLLFLRCGEGSNVQLIERLEGNQSGQLSTDNSLINVMAFVHLEKNASLTHVKWQDLPLYQHLVYKWRITQLRDSRYDLYAFDRGGNQIRNNIDAELEESNTYTSLQSAYYASGKQNIDNQTRINHKVAHCESHELYKGILDEQATAAFNGKVFVHKDAQKTNAYQQNNTLVLSPHAMMNSKPQLEIFADDVKCSHGATIGQLDEDAIFYLRTRGMDPKAASRILKEAFLAEIVEKVPIEEVRDFIMTELTTPS